MLKLADASRIEAELRKTALDVMVEKSKSHTDLVAYGHDLHHSMHGDGCYVLRVSLTDDGTPESHVSMQFHTQDGDWFDTGIEHPAEGDTSWDYLTDFLL